QRTHLELAARYGHRVVSELLIKGGAHVNHRGFHGWTALHYACRSGNEEIV
ncbi:hypothetical protein K432DRAFT_259244, partial [Lepidopterella palustris CBS 459.81]